MKGVIGGVIAEMLSETSALWSVQETAHFQEMIEDVAPLLQSAETELIFFGSSAPQRNCVISNIRADVYAL